MNLPQDYDPNVGLQVQHPHVTSEPQMIILRATHVVLNIHHDPQQLVASSPLETTKLKKSGKF